MESICRIGRQPESTPSALFHQTVLWPSYLLFGAQELQVDTEYYGPDDLTIERVDQYRYSKANAFYNIRRLRPDLWQHTSSHLCCLGCHDHRHLLKNSTPDCTAEHGSFWASCFSRRLLYLHYFIAHLRIPFCNLAINRNCPKEADRLILRRRHRIFLNRNAGELIEI